MFPCSTVIPVFGTIAREARMASLKLFRSMELKRRIKGIVKLRPTFMVLDLDGELPQVLIVLHILINCLANELGTVFAVFLLPLGVFLLFGLLSLLLCGS